MSIEREHNDAILAAQGMAGPPTRPTDLRDWFAGQALAGALSFAAAGDDDIMRSGMTGRDRAQLFAEKSYQIADAMLAAREASDA